MNVKAAVAFSANALYISDVYGWLRRKLTGSQVAILTYHRVAPKENNWSLEPLSPDRFERQIEYICRNYEVISIGKLVQHIRQGGLPERAAVLTFDDGYKDNYLYAYPILKRYEIPAIIFLTTGYIGSGNPFWWDRLKYAIHYTNVDKLDLEELGCYPLLSNLEKSQSSSAIIRKMEALPDERKGFLTEMIVNNCRADIPPDEVSNLILSWDEVRRMGADGIEFGAHTVNHPFLVNMPLENAGWEITQSKKDIEDKLNQPVTAFSYPHGDFNDELVRLVRENGFDSAVTVRPERLIRASDNEYCLSRIDMTRDFSKCKVMLSGLSNDFRIILRRNGESAVPY